MIILNGLCKWFAVPLSATQAPVTGLTDILTPVNLLPNSDFSRSGGYANSIHVTASNTGIRDGFNCYIANATGDVSVTITTNNINITGTITPTGTGAPYIGIRGLYLLTGLFTLSASVRNNIQNFSYQCSTLVSAVVSTVTVIERTVPEITDTEFTRGYMICNGTGFSPTFSFRIGDAVVDVPINVNFDIKNACAYEGEFRNPPYRSSLDVKSWNQFLLTDTYSMLREALINLNNNYRFNSYNYSQTMPIGRVQIIKTVQNGYNQKAVLCVLNNNDNPVGRVYTQSSFSADIFLAPGWGASSGNSFAKYKLVVCIKWEYTDTNPTVVTRLTRYSDDTYNANLTLTAGYDVISKSQVRPYIIISNGNHSNYATLVYVNYQHTFAGYATTLHIPTNEFSIENITA